VEFWFDVGSPYSYLAYRALPALAADAGATIAWRPMLLGGVFKATGNHSPIDIAAKGRWTLLDLQRWASRDGATLNISPHFPFNTLTLMRAAAGLQMTDEPAFQRFLRAVFDAIWSDARNVGEPAELAAVLQAAGFEPQQLLALANDPAAKDKLKQDTEQAVARGVFGAPTFFVGDDMFWGRDRLEFVAAALRA